MDDELTSEQQDELDQAYYDSQLDKKQNGAAYRPSKLTPEQNAEYDAMAKQWPGKSIGFVVDKIEQARKLEARKPATCRSLLDGMIAAGPVVHEPTGFPTLDQNTGGGLTYGSRGFFIGAPDAGKTLVWVQVADLWARRGIVIGAHAVDEEGEDLMTRLMQRLAFSREECERMEPSIVQMMIDKLDSVQREIYFYDDEWSMEDAAEDLKARAGDRKAAYFADSIQTVRCRKVMDEPELGPREVVTGNVLALRKIAKTHRFIAAATCEMNRGGYKDIEKAEKLDDMASGAESRAIEFQARWQIALRSVPDEPELVHARIVKNKLGKSRVDFHLRIDRHRQTLEEIGYERPDLPSTELVDDMEMVRGLIAQAVYVHGKADMRARIRVAGHVMGNDRIDAAIQALIDARTIGNEGTKNRPKWVLRSEF